MRSHTHSPAGNRWRPAWHAGAVGAALALALLFSTGCLYLDQVIVLHKDGSCTVTYRYSVPAEAVPNLATAQRVIEQWQGRAPGPDPNDRQWFLNRTAVSRHFAGRGLTLKNYRAYDKDGRRHAEITVNAANAWVTLENGKFGPFQLTRTPEGDFRLQADIPADPAAAPPTPEHVTRLRALCEGLSLTLTIETPTDIITATASATGGRKATWVFDPSVDDSFLTGTPAIDMTFNGKGLDWDRRK